MAVKHKVVVLNVLDEVIVVDFLRVVAFLELLDILLELVFLVKFKSLWNLSSTVNNLHQVYLITDVILGFITS